MRFIANILSRVIPGLVFTLSAAACILACSSCREEPTQPPPPPATEPDTTSHEFTWTTYTLGDGQSYLSDIFAVNDTDVWTVGEIYLRDSKGNLDLQMYNAAHWDGKIWKPIRIYWHYQGQQGVATLNAVHGFSSKDVWVAPSPTHWDGSAWTSYTVSGVVSGVTAKIWGRSSAELFFVGTNGSLMRFIPWIFEKMESGTTADLYDISGMYEGKIYVCGGYGSSIVLEYDGTRWSKVDSLTNFGKSQRWSVYANPDFLGFGGDGVIYIDRKYGDALRKPPMDVLEGKDVNGLPVGVFSIRGSSRKNIFAVGSWQYIIHYNGKSWRWFSELWDDGGHQQSAIAVTENSVFIAGEKNDRATVLMGIRK